MDDFICSKDYSDNLIIWILEKQAKLLKGYVKNDYQNTLSHVYTKSILSACGVSATRPIVKDVLMLGVDYSLLLWNGFKDIVILCSIPYISDLPASMKRRRSLCDNSSIDQQMNRRNSYVVEIEELKDHQVRICLSSGNCIRGNLDFTIPALVRSCLNVLQYSLPAPMWQLVQSRYLTYSFGSENQNSNWDNFMIVFFSFFIKNNPQFLNDKQSSNILMTDSEANADDWESMMSNLSNDFSTLPYRLQKIIDSNISSTSLQTSSSFHMDSIFNSAIVLSSSEKCRQRLTEYAHSIIFCLHLLFEELSLTLHSQSEARLLGMLLNQFAYSMGFDNYSEIYIQDEVKYFSSNVSLMNPSVDQTSLYKPVQFSQWVLEVVRRKSILFFPLDALDSIGLKDKRLFCECPNISNISILYSALYDDMDEKTGVLREMVQLKMKVEDLDSFQTGIAMPLREVLFECRHNEHLVLSKVNSLGEEAFRLIGRYDLSSTASYKQDNLIEQVNPLFMIVFPS